MFSRFVRSRELDVVCTIAFVLILGVSNVEAGNATEMKRCPEFVTKVFSIKNADLDKVAEQVEQVIDRQKGELSVDQRNRLLIMTGTWKRIRQAEATIKKLEAQAVPAVPDPTQKYKIDQILQSSAILNDYYTGKSIGIREGLVVDHTLGNFRIEEIDRTNRRIRVRLISDGSERCITEWEKDRAEGSCRNAFRQSHEKH